MSFLRWCGVVLVCLLSLSWSLGQSGLSGFEAANRLYEEGKYAEAVAAYEKLLASGQASEAVYFNLGNACFKSRQIGRAVAAYREAQRLNPRDPDVRANLQFARNQVQGPSAGTASWQRWLGRLSLNEWTVLASGLAWLWLGLVALAQWRPVWKLALRPYQIGALLATVAAGVCLGLACRERYFSRRAVVVVAEVTVRQGPLDESQPAFRAYDGAELEVLDHKDQWLQVSTDPRRFGWVRQDQVMVIPR
jgi:tetratricopeptide (TPR) repeat protein